MNFAYKVLMSILRPALAQRKDRTFMDIQKRISKTLRLDTGSSETKRQELKAYFNQTFSLYESLFRLISDDQAFYARAEPLRHPLVFYFGHTATFFINKLLLAKLID